MKTEKKLKAPQLLNTRANIALETNGLFWLQLAMSWNKTKIRMVMWYHHKIRLLLYLCPSKLAVWILQIYKGDPRPRIPPRVMASSAIGLKLGVLGFLPTNTQKQMQNKWVHDLRAPCSVLRQFYLNAQTLVDAGDIRTWQPRLFSLREKPEDPQFEPHAEVKMAQVLGSPLYICVEYNCDKVFNHQCSVSTIDMRMLWYH